MLTTIVVVPTSQVHEVAPSEPMVVPTPATIPSLQLNESNVSDGSQVR